MFSIRFNLPTKIVFERGSITKVGCEAEELGKKALIVITRGGSMIKFGYLGNVRLSLEARGIKYVVYNNVSSNPRVEEVEKGVEVAEKEGCDFVIGLGGGSAIDTAKAIAATLGSGKPFIKYLRKEKEVSTAYPIVAIPTTHGTGSEVDKYAVITDVERKAKLTLISRHIYPKVAILDPETTVTLPPQLTAATAFDALSHAFEAYVNRSTNRLARVFAAESMKNIIENIEHAVKHGLNIAVRTRLLWASMLAGLAIDLVRTALCHAMEHPLSAYYPHVHHGLGLTILMPAWMKFTLESAKEDFAEIAKILGLKTEELTIDQAAKAVYDFVVDLRKKVGLNFKLRDLGVKVEDIDAMVENAFTYMKALIENNPRVPTKDELKKIYLESY